MKIFWFLNAQNVALFYQEGSVNQNNNNNDKRPSLMMPCSSIGSWELSSPPFRDPWSSWVALPPLWIYADLTWGANVNEQSWSITREQYELWEDKQPTGLDFLFKQNIQRGCQGLELETLSLFRRRFLFPPGDPAARRHGVIHNTHVWYRIKNSIWPSINEHKGVWEVVTSKHLGIQRLLCDSVAEETSCKHIWQLLNAPVFHHLVAKYWFLELFSSNPLVAAAVNIWKSREPWNQSDVLRSTE